MTAIRNRTDAAIAAMNSSDRQTLLDAIEIYSAMLGRIDRGELPPDDELQDARTTLEDALTTDFATGDNPHAWNARHQAHALLNDSDAEHWKDAPGLAAAREIVAAVHERDDSDKLDQTVARVVLQPGRRDALAALTDVGLSIARTELEACSDRTWRAVSRHITPLRNERRRQHRDAQDPWSTPIPDDARKAARQAQRHLAAGWRHPDLDHFDRSGGLGGGDVYFEAVLVDGTRFPFASAAELTSPQRILGRLQACRITGIDPDQLKGRALARLAALVDAASVEVQGDSAASETAEWLTTYAQNCPDDDHRADAIHANGPFHKDGLLHIHTGAMRQWLERGPIGVRIERQPLERRLRGVDARALPQERPIQATYGGKRISRRYWTWQEPADGGS